MPHALDKRVPRMTLNLAEMLDVETKARAAGQSVNNYRAEQLGVAGAHCGQADRRGTSREEDDALDRFQRLALDAQVYLPDY